MMPPHLHLITILMALLNCSMSEEYDGSGWTAVSEYVDPVIVSSTDYSGRVKISSRDARTSGATRPETLRVKIGNWTLSTTRNEELLVSPKFEIRWINGSTDISESRNILNSRHCSMCDVRQGHVLDDHLSRVALTICDGEFYVMIRSRRRLFYVRPLDDGRHLLEERSTNGPDATSDVDTRRTIARLKRDESFGKRSIRGIAKMLRGSSVHYRPVSGTYDASTARDPDDYRDTRGLWGKWSTTRGTGRNKRAVCANKVFYNLTGDTFDIENDQRPVNVEKHLGARLDDHGVEDRPTSTRDTRIDNAGDGGADDNEKENVGYFYDRTWEKSKLPRKKIIGKELPPRWLELGIAIDYSVINFHGHRVQQYVLALLNIVSAIYKDPSLDSNLRLVIVRMIFYSEKSDGMVRQGDARKSLENVNKWNRKLLSSADENHDVAVWLTRLDIGGPSGYAPVSGACDPARSCALNRDEGLTSAFIIAHEVAHILGLTHDGDESAGNTCGEEASMGSVMAPMVAATFHRFHWSSCSRKEFHRHSKHFRCLENKPSDGNSTHLGRETARETFTMDEQCRMEFGEGYALCRSFELPGPCSHLWCGHASASEVCKTKKGPPLEGTICGKNKWCINGYCEFIDQKRFGLDRGSDGPRDGGWSSWTSWGKCSRSCGVGVRFRFRQCNEPTPAYGGKYCDGNSEDFETCEQANCSVQVDPRQRQCLRLPILVGLRENSPKFSMTWLPHEPDEEHLKCRIACRSAETGEIFLSQESLTDGTPCSYGSTDICVQGTCRRMGCDKIFDSEMRIDSCGVCNGNDTTCSRTTNKLNRKIRRGTTRVAIVPRGSYDVSVNVTIASHASLAHENLTFTIRDRRRRRNDLYDFEPTDDSRTTIVEGTAFRSRRHGDVYEIWSRGPVHAEIVISLTVPEVAVKSGVTISGIYRYVVNRKDSASKTRYSWIFGDWSPCSASCGGGLRHKTIACRDDETGRQTSRKKCSLLTRPAKQVEKCNNFGCRFKWIPGPWQGCTTTCGRHGIQYRDIFCVHASFADKHLTSDNELTLYRATVPPARCKGERKPETKGECNRIPCPGSWIFGNWSSLRKNIFASKLIGET